MDITEIILNDHHRQRQMFALLDNVDPDDTKRLGLVWGDIADFLEVHAAAEEVVFYPQLLKYADPDREETKDAIADHNDIREAVTAAAQHEVGSKEWWKAVGDARAANTEHMGEEEDEGLPDFRKHTSLELRHELAVEFESVKTAPVADDLPREPKDPEEYVEDHAP